MRPVRHKNLKCVRDKTACFVTSQRTRHNCPAIVWLGTLKDIGSMRAQFCNSFMQELKCLFNSAIRKRFIKFNYFRTSFMIYVQMQRRRTSHLYLRQLLDTDISRLTQNGAKCISGIRLSQMYLLRTRKLMRHILTLETFYPRLV